MADEVHEVVEGDGYALGNIDAMGEQYGFHKVRREVGVTEFGANAITMPAGYASDGHYHDEQQELYFVHRGKLELRFGDGAKHVLGPGGVARVEAATVRSLRNAGDEDAVYLCVGAKDGYVGRDGHQEGERVVAPSSGEEPAQAQ
jgi:quercetin dioxygenase-like cupin family protein